MKILSLETTSEIGSLAFLEDNEIKYEVYFNDFDISGQLTPNLLNLLKKSHIALSEIDYFVVSNGPGSWTGTRGGLSFTLGLAKGDRTRIYSISLPQSIFFGIKDLNLPAINLINAYSGKLYVSYFTSRFYYKSNYLPEKKTIEEILETDLLKNFLIVGPGVSLLNERVKNTKNFKVAKNHFFPRAGINGLLAYEKIKRGIPSLDLKPYYGK